MLIRNNTIGEKNLRQLHSASIEIDSEIDRFIERLFYENIPLKRGLNKNILPEVAKIINLTESEIVLETKNFDLSNLDEIFLNAEIKGERFFFATNCTRKLSETSLCIQKPKIVYKTERRDRKRATISRDLSTPITVRIQHTGTNPTDAIVVDLSPDGMAIHAPQEVKLSVDNEIHVAGLQSNKNVFGKVRNVAPCKERPGWLRIGLSLSTSPWNSYLPVHHKKNIANKNTTLSTQDKITTATTSPRYDSAPRINLIDCYNHKGERIRAIVDSWGDTRGATAVIIPPAWGKTKETLLPLALTIIETFKHSHIPIVVLRFDGIRKRGESHNDPECVDLENKQIHFTLSQGTRDIQTTLDYLESNPLFRPSKIVLVTFSISSIDGRKALVRDPKRITGWISVVGTADLQSVMKVVSGGIDYVGGVEQGIKFGIREVIGIKTNIDHVFSDAIREEMAFLDDARRDFLSINAPITWIHGLYDAWMNLDRIQHALSFGNIQNRKLITIPTGHQLQNSQEAFETFQLISTEIGRMTHGYELPQRLPNFTDLNLRRQAERKRLTKRNPDLHQFWQNYLLGRQQQAGMELLNLTNPYESLFEAQLRNLHLKPGNRVADLGAGVGVFPTRLSTKKQKLERLTVYEFDYIHNALTRTRRNLVNGGNNLKLSTFYIESNLNITASNNYVPVRDEYFDAVLMSLLLCYVTEPTKLLNEAARILNKGGRLVLSTLKPDADISRIYMDLLKEARKKGIHELLGLPKSTPVDDLARDLMNEASKLLDFEESGLFQFWKPKELEELLIQAGFHQVKTELSFGSPPQAIIASAKRI